MGRLAQLLLYRSTSKPGFKTFRKKMAETDLENQTKAQNGKSPEASPEKKDESSSKDNKAKAMMSLVSGKRHLLVQDISSAVASLGEACELLAVEFGDKAPECAEAYFYYGKALLEMFRLEAGVLGNIDAEDEESEEKSEDEEDGEEDQAEAEPDEDDKGEGSEEKEEAEAAAEPEKEKEETDSVEGDKKEVEDAAALEAEDEDDPSNLQLSWEMLELAKMVLLDQLEGEASKALSEENKTMIEKRLFETFLTLGEVSLENENYPQAVEDLTLCLNKQQAVLPEDSRNIAVTFYQLGIALGFNMKYEEAVVKLEEAISVLKKRIDNLKNKTESFDESKKDDVFYSREKEIAEIEALIPEIQEKIADTVEMKEENNRKMAEVKEQMGFGSSSFGSDPGAGSSGTSGATKPISSISIKRKTETSSTDPAKKVRTETDIFKANGQSS